MVYISYLTLFDVVDLHRKRSGSSTIKKKLPEHQSDAAMHTKISDESTAIKRWLRGLLVHVRA